MFAQRAFLAGQSRDQNGSGREYVGMISGEVGAKKKAYPWLQIRPERTWRTSGHPFADPAYEPGLHGPLP